MDLKSLESVMVDAIVVDASNNCVALTVGEVFGNAHLIVRPATVHPSVATARDRMLEEIRAVNMPDFVRTSVEAIIDKHLGIGSSAITPGAAEKRALDVLTSTSRPG